MTSKQKKTKKRWNQTQILSFYRFHDIQRCCCCCCHWRICRRNIDSHVQYIDRHSDCSLWEMNTNWQIKQRFVVWHEKFILPVIGRRISVIIRLIVPIVAITIVRLITIIRILTSISAVLLVVVVSIIIIVVISSYFVSHFQRFNIRSTARSAQKPAKIITKIHPELVSLTSIFVIFSCYSFLLLKT